MTVSDLRRTGVRHDSGEKPVLSSKGVFDIHEKTTPQEVYSSEATDLAREEVKGSVKETVAYYRR